MMMSTTNKSILIIAFLSGRFFFLPNILSADAFLAPSSSSAWMAAYSVSTIHTAQRRQVVVAAGHHRFLPSSSAYIPEIPLQHYQAHHSTTIDGLLTQSSLSSSSSSLIMTAIDNDINIINEEAFAFNDRINFLDGPIVTMLGVFGVVIVILIGSKLLTGQMDSAIEQVLVDFETTMKESYPQRWQSELRPRLEGLEGERRQETLYKIMEEIQSKDPVFMSRVQQKMKK
jgi:hypothetical protein